MRILANTNCIGLVESARWGRRAKGDLGAFYKDIAKCVPLGRVGEAEGFGDLVAFLVSERAAFITGTAINFDGGMSSAVSTTSRRWPTPSSTSASSPRSRRRCSSMPRKSTKRTGAAMPRRQCVRIFRHAIAGWPVLALLAGCTTVTPPPASHPSKSLGAQNDDKYECWTEARFLTGHDPEASSPMGRLVGAVIGGAIAGGRDAPVVAVAIHRPSPTTSAVESFRGAYETCLTGRGYRMEGAR